MGNGASETLYCSFCGKSQHEVERLIAGPTAFICNECVGLCASILVHELGNPQSPSRLYLSRTPPADSKEIIAEIVRQIRAEEAGKADGPNN